MKFGNNQPRTPNGATDLLYNDPPPSSSYPPHLNFIHDDGDDDDELPPPSPMSSRHGGNADCEIFKRLDSFEAKLESELDDLEALGVAARPDPDGKGERPVSTSPATVTTASSRSSSSSVSSSRGKNNNIVMQSVYNAANNILEKGKGKSGKKLTKLSHKTNKIMSDYQAYLSEIQTGYPLSFDDSVSSTEDEQTAFVTSMQEDLENPALTNIVQVREDLKGSYLERQEQKEHEKLREPDARLSGIMESSSRDDGRYAVGEGQPLYRMWSNDDGPSSASSPSPDSSMHGYDYATVFGESLLANSSKDTCGRKRYRNGAPPLPGCLRSKRVRRGLMTIVLVSLIIGISLGVANIKKQEALPDWEGEYEAEILEEEFAKEEKLEEELREKVEMGKEIKMQPLAPVLPSQPKGGGDSHFQDKLAQMEKEKKEGEKMMMEEHSTVTKEAQAILEEATTPEEAIVEEVTPAEATVEEEVAAPAETVVEEVTTPEEEESTTGETDDKSDSSDIAFIEEEAKEHGLGEALAMDIYYNAVVQYRPTMYDRSKGWTGTTYVEALVFCDSQGGLAVCPYDAVCPDGQNGEPLGGYRHGPHGDWAWVPVVDDYNEWVQVSAREKCAKYSARNGEKPVWGTSGVDEDGNDSEDLTQNVMCCLNVM